MKPAFGLVFSFVFFVSFVDALGAADPTYWQDVRPLLRKHCTVCHNTRNLAEPAVSGGLSLGTYEAIRKGAKTPVLIPGKSADSVMIHLLITKDEKKRMPLEANALEQAEIDLLRRWIDTGATEGKKPDDDSTPTPVVTPTARTRKLDVTLATAAIPPKGALGVAVPTKLDLILKVGPLSPVAAVTFSPDGKLLATGTYGRVTLWDLTTAKPVKVLTNVLGAVNDLRFSPDGKLLVVAGGQPSARGDIRLYAVEDWKLLATLGGHDDVVNCVAFTADGKHLASASFDKTVGIWDVASRKMERKLTGHSDFVYSVAFDPQGKWLVSSSKDRSVKMAEVDTGKSLMTFSGMNDDILAVAVSPDGKQVISSGFEPGLFVWNPQTGERVRVQGGHGVAVHEVCFSKDGQLVVSAGADKTVRIWNASGGTLTKTLPVGSIAYATAISPNGKLVAAGSFDGLVRLWDVASGRQLLTLLSLPPQGENFDWLALTPEGYAAGSDKLIALGRWTMAGKPLAADAVWKALQRPEAVAQAAQGQEVKPPSFDK
jgi:WD40 repeat protein